MKRSFFILPALALLVCSACAHAGPRHINIWPLVYYSQDSRNETKTLSILTPIVYYHREKETREFSVRPVFSVKKDASNDSAVVDILYPLIKYRKRGGDRKFRVFPILKDETAEVFPDKSRTAHDYFPVYWGRSEDGKPYGGLFPIYGTVKKRFGKDDILFVLWPAYSRTVEDSTVSHTVLWPMFSHKTGETVHGTRIFPLWGHEETAGKDYETFFVFPLVTFRGRYLDTPAPVTDTMIIPFYVSRRSPHARSTSYLWPFFTVSRNDETNYIKVDAPWPLISLAWSDTLSLVQIAPFYRKRVTTERGATDERMYILYPIFSHSRFVSEEKTEDTVRFMLIDKFERTSYSDGTGDLWVYFFPVYDRRKSRTGGETTVVFYPLPLYDDGFERNLLPLFEIVRHETAEDGTDRLAVFHHLLIRETRGGDVRTLDVPFYFRQQIQ
jgi:hypothetical protein